MGYLGKERKMYPVEYRQAKVYMEQRQRDAEHDRLVREALGTAPRRNNLLTALRARIAALWTKWEADPLHSIPLTGRPAGTGKPA